MSIGSLKLNCIEFLVTEPMQASVGEEMRRSVFTVPERGMQFDVVPVVRTTDVKKGGGISGFTRKLNGATAPIDVPEALLTEPEIPKLYLFPALYAESGVKVRTVFPADHE